MTLFLFLVCNAWSISGISQTFYNPWALFVIAFRLGCRIWSMEISQHFHSWIIAFWHAVWDVAPTAGCRSCTPSCCFDHAAMGRGQGQKQGLRSFLLVPFLGQEPKNNNAKLWQMSRSLGDGMPGIFLRLGNFFRTATSCNLSFFQQHQPLQSLQQNLHQRQYPDPRAWVWYLSHQLEYVFLGRFGETSMLVAMEANKHALTCTHWEYM